MRIQINIDEKLIAEAQKLGNIKTKKAAVEHALRLFIQLENQKKLIDWWGKVKFFPPTEV